MTLVQLRQAGLGGSAISNRVANGRLHRRYRGVYAVGHPKLSEKAEWMAAVLAAGEGTALSHLSAAALWRIWRRRAAGIDVVAPRQRRLRGVRVHTFRRLDPRDVTTRNGIPVTTVARTLVDLTDSLDQYQLANVIHEAAFLELFNARATTTAMARANGRHHLASLNAAVRAHNTGSAGTRSKLEDRFLALVHEAGLPEPRVNTHVHTASRSIEVDFHWPELNLCVEVDGHGHNRPPTRQDDQARDAALTAAGHRVVRLAEHDLDLQAVLGRIRA